MSDKIFFSTNSEIAFKLSKKYFNGRTRIWASPNFAGNPSSSNPKNIYKRLAEDCATNDRGSLKIRQIKASLKKAALFHLKNAVISENDYKSILYILQTAQHSDFAPLLYIINIDEIERENVIIPDIRHKADPFSDEIIISDLEVSRVKIIDFYDAVQNILTKSR